MPNVWDVVNNNAQYKWFSSFELKSAYHQVPILLEERHYTALESNRQLYQFKRIPFCLKNAVPCFQRVINDIIDRYGCKATYAHLDDFTVCGRTREEHDQNLSTFLKAAKDCNLTFNNGKCKFTKNSLTLRGFSISDGVLKPDPERVNPVLEMQVPTSQKQLQRVVGVFAYYAQWISQLSEKIKPLISATEFPLGSGGLRGAYWVTARGPQHLGVPQTLSRKKV